MELIDLDTLAVLDNTGRGFRRSVVRRTYRSRYRCFPGLTHAGSYQHCQRLAPEYSKAALGLYPLVPSYAVDCDNPTNKRLCAEQGIQGFPTLKVRVATLRTIPRGLSSIFLPQLFPRGNQVKPIEYTHGERSASAIYYWVTRNVPHKVKKLYNIEEIEPWVEEVRPPCLRACAELTDRAEQRSAPCPPSEPGQAHPDAVASYERPVPGAPEVCGPPRSLRTQLREDGLREGPEGLSKGAHLSRWLDRLRPLRRYCHFVLVSNSGIGQLTVSFSN